MPKICSGEGEGCYYRSLPSYPYLCACSGLVLQYVVCAGHDSRDLRRFIRWGRSQSVLWLMLSVSCQITLDGQIWVGGYVRLIQWSLYFECTVLLSSWEESPKLPGVSHDKHQIISVTAIFQLHCIKYTVVMKKVISLWWLWRFSESNACDLNRHPL